MRKALTLIALAPAMAFGQSLVADTPQNRTALLEDFTGIHCGYCPEGHAIMASLAAIHGDKLVNVGIHANTYAVPGVGEPDFRTPDGNAIDAYYAITGYPSGVINRRPSGGVTVLNRGAWEGAVNAALALPSPVNVGVESSYDGTNLTVHVVAYYTANSPAGNDFISVLVLEDHLDGPQTDYTNGNHTNYDHIHVLRDYITDTWGEDVGNHVAGEFVERTYVFPVPSAWNIANCEVVAFVSEDHSEVYQARGVAADGGTTLVIGDLQGDQLDYRSGTSTVTTAFNGGFTNLVGADEEYEITLTSNNAPVSWQSGFTVNGIPQTNPATVNIVDGGSITLDVQVTPDVAVGIGKYVLTVVSTTNPGAPALHADYNVISGVHDLVVSNPEAEAHEPLYMNGMAAENAKASTTRGDFLGFGNAGALTNVYNLYLNISWTFPSYTDEVVNVLSTFMDNGGNLMIAGQDIGWDQSGATGSYGTPVTRAFYTNYLHAQYVADGAPSDNQVDFVDADPVFGQVASTTLVNIFGAANTYPDQINPLAPAVAIMRYSPTKIGGLRAHLSNHKVVYFGIGPEQVLSTAIAMQMVQLSHDWFYGTVGTAEFDAAMSALGQAYPSPADAQVNIPIGARTGAATLEVFDATGHLVMSEAVTTERSIITLETGRLSNGLYNARLRTNEGYGTSSTFMVAR